MIDEHDMTKKILDNMRLINEETNVSEGMDLTGPELKNELDKFRETISPRVEFDIFKLYPQANNVVFSGKFQILGGMDWQFSMSDADGVYVSVDNLQLTDEAVQLIQKLQGYYKVWVKEWATKLATEYK